MISYTEFNNKILVIIFMGPMSRVVRSTAGPWSLMKVNVPTVKISSYNKVLRGRLVLRQFIYTGLNGTNSLTI